jgi:serine protease AprX
MKTSMDRNNRQSSSRPHSGTAWGTRFLSLAGLLLLAASLAFAGPQKHNPKMADELGVVDQNSTVDVIIQYKQVPTEAHHQKVRNKGGALQRELHVIKGGHYSVPASALAELAADPDVAYIAPNRPLTGSLDYTAAAVGAPTAWTNYGLDGTGVGVAIIDSGVYSNAKDFNNKTSVTYSCTNDAGVVSTCTNYPTRVVYSQDFVGTGTNDGYGHGTHVAGIVGSGGQGSSCESCIRKFKGIAPNVNLINLRVLDQNGNGTDSNVIAAIQQAIALKSTYNIRVINLSLGRPAMQSYTQDPLCQAVESAWKAGIVVVVAAGNFGRDDSQKTKGYGTILAPGNDPYVITVGAMKTNGTMSTTDDTVASYSSKGPTGFDHIAKPDLVAPGNVVASDYNPNGTISTSYPANLLPIAYYMNTTNTGDSQRYFFLSGTSMATPVVSGAAAILLQQNASLTPDQVKARLMKTASKDFPSNSTVTDTTVTPNVVYTDYYDIFTVGAGYLNIPAALANTDLAIGAALSPSATYNSADGSVHLVDGTSVCWGTSVAWGTSVVWGTNVILPGSVVWGTNNTEVNGSAVVWGTGVVWGTANPTGFSVVWGTGDLVNASSSTVAQAQSLFIHGEKAK